MEASCVDASIVVPVFNVEGYISQCVDSILIQTFSNFELILVDDGSTDESGAICDRFARSDKRVRVIHQPNQGSSVARNAGIASACGNYILFLDSDDYWKDACVLENVIGKIKRTHPDVLVFNYEKTDCKTYHKTYFSAPTIILSEETDSFKLLSENDLWTACAWNKAIRRQLFSGGNLFFKPGITSEDIDWSLRLALSANSFDYLDMPVVCYRQRNESISKSITEKKVDILLDNIVCCMELLSMAENAARVESLKRYVAYQYGTALQCLSALPENPQKEQLRTRCESLKYLLNWSDNSRIKVLKLISKIGGLRLTDRLLQIRSKII